MSYRIILDMDQILCDWVQRILEWWNEDHDTNLTKESIKTWEMTDTLKGKEGHYFIRAAMRYPEFYRDLDPIPGAIAGTRMLLDSGHDVIIATACPPSAGIAYSGKLEWLRRNMPFFPLENFVSIKRKYLLQGDLLFDDGMHNALDWINETYRPVIVMNNSWNKPDPKGEAPLIKRVDSWTEFMAKYNGHIRSFSW